MLFLELKLGIGNPPDSALTMMFGNTSCSNNNVNANTYLPPAPSLSFASCNGNIDGACNTANIYLFYHTYKTGYNITTASKSTCSPVPEMPFPTPSIGSTSLTYYATGLCKNYSIGIYSDWYLPAICEMDSISRTVICPLDTQSMVANLSFLLGDPTATMPSPRTSCIPPNNTDCLAGLYWSSTEASFGSMINAWNEYFSSDMSNSVSRGKYLQLGVRCTRLLTF